MILFFFVKRSPGFIFFFFSFFPHIKMSSVSEARSAFRSLHPRYEEFREKLYCYPLTRGGAEFLIQLIHEKPEWPVTDATQRLSCKALFARALFRVMS